MSRWVGVTPASVRRAFGYAAYVASYLPLSGGTLTGSLTLSSGLIELPANSEIRWTAQSRIFSVGDGVLSLRNWAGSDFTRLQFGGTTSSFPAISRVGAEVGFVLADASGWANVRTGLIQSQPDVALTAGGSASAGLAISSSSIRVIAGSGVPTVSAAQGTLYLRSDGSSGSTRLYVNTNGTTGWTNVTTAT